MALPNKLSLRFPHDMDVSDLRHRLSERLTYLREYYADTVDISDEQWSDDRVGLRVSKGPASATVKVVLSQSMISVAVTLPFLAMAFRPKIEGRVAKEVNELTKA